MRSPIRIVRAGTRKVRTTSASMSTPSATMIASCRRNWIGITSSAAKVAASTTPALVMTPPVSDRPRSVPSRVPWTSDSSRTRVMRKML